MNIFKLERVSYLLLLIIALAFLLRHSTLKYHIIPGGDEGSILSLALNISDGKGFTSNVMWLQISL